MTILEHYGKQAAKHPEIVIGIALICTIIMAVYAMQLEIETDFEKSLPERLDAIQHNQLLRDKFENPQSFFILVKLNEDKSLPGFIDIRDPELMNSLATLEERLQQDPEISGVFGPPDLLIQTFGFVPDDPDHVNTVFAQSPELFSRDYSSTVLVVKTIIGTDDTKILHFVKKIEDYIDSIGFSGSVQLEVTGGLFVRTTIFSLLLDDLVRTVSIAALFILFVLIIAYRSLIKGLYAVTLLLLALIWTGGTMRLLNIPLSIITIMVGSLIIGIGIDYIIHMVNRYEEERKKGKGGEEASGIAVKRVGIAIVATSATTMVSFLSQAGAGIPLMTHMGIALSLGIAYALIAAIFVLPSVIALEERLRVWRKL